MPKSAGHCPHCPQVFEECRRRCRGDVNAALRATFESLDKYVEGHRGLRVARGDSGAVGVLMFVDFPEKRATVANLGTTQCLLGFAHQDPVTLEPLGTMLTAEHTAKG